MTTKKLYILSAAALALCVVAYLSNGKNAVTTPSSYGKTLFPNLDMSQVALIEIARPSGDKLVLSGTDTGWKIDSMHGYPADLVKIRENVMKLMNLKAGHEARGRKLENATTVKMKNEAGKPLAELSLGAEHFRKPPEDQMGFGGYPDGRYVSVDGDAAVILVDSTLSSFDGEAGDWTDMQIPSVSASAFKTVELSTQSEKLTLTKTNGVWSLADLAEEEEMDAAKTYSLDSALSYLRFTDIADPALTEDQLGLTTGSVFRAVLDNGETYTAKVGNAGEGGRYLKLAASFAPRGTNATENAANEAKVATFNEKTGKWIYVVSQPSAEKLTLGRSDLVKKKDKPAEEPKAEAPKD